MAAVAMSPPHESSSVIAMPMLTQRSRACLILVRPPSLLILRLTTSIARSALARSRTPRSSIVLIQHERVRDLASNGEAFLVGEARLFDVNIHVAHGLGDADGFVLHPAGVGVGHKSVAGLEFRGNGMDARDIHIGIAADFELEAPIAFRAIATRLSRPFPPGDSCEMAR